MRAVIREIIETIILSLLLFVGIQFAVQTYQVEGASMRPTLTQGQYLLVNKIVYRHLNVGGDAEVAVMGSELSEDSLISHFTHRSTVKWSSSASQTTHRGTS